MATGLEVLDGSVQETDRWLRELSERLGTSDRQRAFAVLRAVLHALRDRIGQAHAIHLGAQLPLIIRGLYFEGWSLGGTTAEWHAVEFRARVRRELGAGEDLEIEDTVCAVFGLLARKLDFGETVKIAATLPEVRSLWPLLVQEAIGARQASAP